MSDLHLEMSGNARYIQENPIIPAGEVLILGGDITSLSYATSRKLEKDFFKKLSTQFERVYWFPANHEFYNSRDASMLDKPLREELHKNVLLVNNLTMTHGPVRFLLSTLWTEIDQLNERAVGFGMLDFQVITYRNKRLTPAVYTRELHRPSLAFLRSELAKPHDGPTVIATHHLPSLQCVHPRHKGSPLQQSFANDLDELILETQPDYWLYGHSHGNRPPFQIGNTQLLSNMLGYVGAYGEQDGYENPATIRVCPE